MSNDEIRFLVQLARNCDTGCRWLEVGSFCGRSLLTVGLSLPNGSTLESVDRNWGSTRQAEISVHDVFQEIVQDRAETLNLHVIRATSEEASHVFRVDWFNFAFIDAARDHDSVALDIRSWRTKIKPGGLICGHDYYAGWPGVVRAVDEAFVAVQIEHTIWLYKN